MVDGRTDADGRRLDGYTISSPCEPKGSGEINCLHQLRKLIACQVLTGCGMPRLKNSDSLAMVRNSALQFVSLRSDSHLIAHYR